MCNSETILWLKKIQITIYKWSYASFLLYNPESPSQAFLRLSCCTTFSVNPKIGASFGTANPQIGNIRRDAHHDSDKFVLWLCALKTIHVDV